MIRLIGFGVLILCSVLSGYLCVCTIRSANGYSWHAALASVLALAGCVAGGTLLAFFHVGFLGENFSAVQDGQCYRSAQLSPQALESRVRQKGIKTVVNLRGASRNQWYASQREVLEDMNVTLLDIPLDTQELPSPESMTELIRTFHSGERPLLLHCNHGVDRTGIAAVLYRTIVEKDSLEKAIASEQSIWSGHFATSNNDAGDRFFELYQSDQKNLSLEAWIRDEYPAKYAETLLSEKELSKVEWYNAPYRLGPVVLTPFKLLGIFGASLFACRWFVQAYYSRRAGRPVTPLNFWLMSILGSLLMLFYFTFSAKQDIVGIISNLFPAIVAAYNVYLELRYRTRKNMGLAAPVLDAVPAAVASGPRDFNP